MEAVPRLHMLWFALKSSPEGTSFAALKKVGCNESRQLRQRRNGDGRRTYQLKVQGVAGGGQHLRRKLIRKMLSFVTTCRPPALQYGACK